MTFLEIILHGYYYNGNCLVKSPFHGLLVPVISGAHHQTAEILALLSSVSTLFIAKH